MSSVAVTIGQQTPRVHVVPSYASSAGGEAIEVAEVAGLHLDPWQKLVLTDALGETPAGRWAAYRVGLEVARQNGKGGVLEARELAGLFAFGEKLIIHSAHEQATATEHFNRVLALMEGVPEFDRRILKPVRGKGQEAIHLRGGQRIFFKTRTGGGGRGFTGDLVVFDEAMILPSSFMAALVPTMAARSMVGDPQLWFVGSAVDQQNPKLDGLEFARVRRDALKCADDRLAYFGWSPPFDSPDKVPATALDDPEVWAWGNPGMGIRIGRGYIADERRALGAREFCVERLGVGDWPDPDLLAAGQVISDETWNGLVATDASKPPGPVCFAFDVTPDRAFAAIAVAGYRADGRRQVQVIDHHRGTGWVVDRLAELTDKHRTVKDGVRCDAKSPAASLLPDLDDRRVKVEPIGAAEHAQACGAFFDACDQDTLRHFAQEELDAAVKGAVKRSLAGAWAWDRNSSDVDISPLVACTLALWGVGAAKSKGKEPLVAWA